MPDLVGQRAILAVAQLPFETASETGTYHLFGTLTPVLLEGGSAANETDFPNNGLVWWMVRPGVSQLAQPGRLVSGTLELAYQYKADEPDKMLYQINRDSVESIKPDDAVEILTVQNSDVRSPRDLVNVRHVVSVDHPPSPAVFVRWREDVYGPFRTTFEYENVERNLYLVTLAMRAPGEEILQIPSERVAALMAKGYVTAIAVDVSLESSQRRRSGRVVSCRYEILRGPGLKELDKLAAVRLKLESDAEVLSRISRELLTRAKRQQFRALLRELGDRVDQTLGPNGEEAIVIRSALQAVEANENEAQTRPQRVSTHVAAGRPDRSLRCESDCKRAVRRSNTRSSWDFCTSCAAE